MWRFPVFEVGLEKLTGGVQSSNGRFLACVTRDGFLTPFPHPASRRYVISQRHSASNSCRTQLPRDRRIERIIRISHLPWLELSLTPSPFGALGPKYTSTDPSSFTCRPLSVEATPTLDWLRIQAAEPESASHARHLPALASEKYRHRRCKEPIFPCD